VSTVAEYGTDGTVREWNDTVVRHGTLWYDIVLDPYFSRTVLIFLKNQHGTAHNGTKTRHNMIQHESTTRYEMKIPHDMT
jgi:hypothetical protein